LSALLVLSFSLIYFDESTPTHLKAVCVALLLVGASVGVAWLLRNGKLIQAASVMAAASLVGIAAFFQYAASSATLNLSRNTAALLDSVDPDRELTVRMVDYKEGSLAFYRAENIFEQSDEQFLEKQPASKWPSMLVTTPRHWKTVPPEIQSRWRQVGEELTGMNVARGNFSSTLVFVQRIDPTGPTTRGE